MFDRHRWQELLSAEERARGYGDGFKLLFCPWRLIDTADTAFISLNPGHDPSGEFMRVASDERGNSYLVQRAARHSPIAAQFAALCDFIGKNPQEVLTGALMPYRTDRWQPERDRANLAMAQPFWGPILSNGRVRQVFCMGRAVEDAVVQMTEARLDMEVPANWGTLTLRRHVTRTGAHIYGLLHLSTYKMFGRPACLPQLQRLMAV